MHRRVLKDRYELQDPLGGGSASTTYLAQDSELGARCVVKELSVGEVVRGDRGTHSFDADDFTKLIELFKREARVLAHLDHPGIPRFIDHFSVASEDDTRLYTVQEYVQGETLEALVRNGRHFTEDEAVNICRRATAVLRYLHGRSPPLVHRDIKPSNVILDADGTVHLVDFGLVLNRVGGGELDGRTIVGTYGYMPIEQYEARAQPQSDFCALGMTLVYVLSHKEPTKISRRSMKLEFRSHVNVSEGFAQVLERMIEPAPEDRFASADELLDALDGASDVVVYQPQQVVAAAGSPVAVRVLFVGISAMLLVILAFLFLLAPA
ncbi:MAG TPA: serine/threonine protein kinase [Gemmatimonadetes bacterium]|jgi:serine/threonine protein kinase|nr:serine/threonine protein kinase [Gemmatimonadota bacterium]